MLILLPPSQTKRAGGTGAPLDVGGLALPGLREQRETVLDALVTLCSDEERAASVLKLGPRQRGEVAVNLALRSSPTMPAIERYTGVLYDAVEATTLGPDARRWLARHVLIHSAPFGPVGALNRIPAYRLGAGAALPGTPPLRRLWASAVTAAIAQAAPPFVVDLRSEAYVALGPVPTTVPSVYVRIVTAGPDGAVRALNHFNKHAKGALVRRLADERPPARSIRGLQEWLRDAGYRIEEDGDQWRLYDEGK